MSVKDVLQSLVDDNLVDTDKIGTSIYFWAYPSKAMHTVSRQQVLAKMPLLYYSVYLNSGGTGGGDKMDTVSFSPSS